MINGRFPVFALFFGVLVGLAVLMLALAAFSAICLAAGISGGAAVNALPLVAACTGAFCGGFVCALSADSRGMLWGALCAAVIFLLILAPAAVSGGTIGAMCLLRMSVMLISGALGGVIGINSTIRRKRR